MEEKRETNQITENKMGVMPVNKLLVSMALPMVASMLVQALYNVVDSIFVARVSEEALTAVSLAMPIQNLMIAVGVGTSVGVNALLSKNLGEKNHKSANLAAGNGIFLAAVSYLAFLLFGLVGTGLYMRSQTDSAQIVADGTSYVTLVTTLSFCLFGKCIFERLLQSTGKTFQSMLTQGLGAIINLILDHMLIFGYLGFPQLGVAGAAAATVTGQICAGIFAIILNLKVNKEIEFSFAALKPNWMVIKRIYKVGLPAIVMQSIASVMNFGMNQILIAFSSTAAAVLGVYFRLQSFVFMPVFAISNAMVSIVSYNYGARKNDRVTQALKTSIYYALGIMLIGLLVFQLMPELLLIMFDASEEMLAIGVPALRTVSLNFVFAGYCVIVSAFFQALGRGTSSMMISIIRQLVVILPVAYLLSLSGDVNMVWFAFPISEVIAVVLCTFYLWRINRNLVQKL
ncbi:MAG: MATE family efflux transporter [Clostridiales bacterium]|nr:MATE family efflux transporter [Clostridiales bacterium]